LNIVICPNCKTENKCTNIRCEKCGKNLALESKVEPSAKTFENLFALGQIFSGIMAIIVGAMLSSFFIFCIIKGADTITKVTAIPFLICTVSAFIYGTIMIVKCICEKENVSSKKPKTNKNKVINKLENFALNLYNFGFFIFWFGFLIFYDILAIKSWTDGGNQLFFFSLFFWLVGIIMIKGEFKKHK